MPKPRHRKTPARFVFSRNNIGRPVTIYFEGGVKGLPMKNDASPGRTIPDDPRELTDEEYIRPEAPGEYKKKNKRAQIFLSFMMIT